MDRSQVQKLLSETLKLRTTDQELLNTNKLEFLQRLMKAFDHHIPFQNICFTAVQPEKRCAPTVQENIEEVLNGNGGLCWTKNCVFHLLLQALGYHVTPITGSAEKRRDSHDHMMIIARDVQKPGDLYLVDVGFGAGVQPAIPLDFCDESPEYVCYNKVVKWKKEGDAYLRFDKFRPHGAEELESREFTEIVHFDLTPKSLDCIRQSIGDFAYTPGSVFNSFRELRILSEELDAVMVFKNTKLRTYHADGRRETVEFESIDDTIKAITRYLPQFPVEDLVSSYKLWDEHDKKNLDEVKLCCRPTKQTTKCCSKN